MSDSYPPGITGNEPQIVGGWDAVLEDIAEEAGVMGYTDMDIWLAWRLGVGSLALARSVGGNFPSDIDEKGGEAHEEEGKGKEVLG